MAKCYDNVKNLFLESENIIVFVYEMYIICIIVSDNAADGSENTYPMKK